MRDGARVTILDVAARAGVHAATVSRAINRPEQVAEETRRRVEAAVAELGFVPNRAARGLITGRTGNIAVIVPDITNPYFASLVRAVERAARDVDLQVLLVDTGEQADEEGRAARVLGPQVDGIIAVSPRQLHRDLDAFGATSAVFVNRTVKGHPSVLLRSAAAAKDALHHLASLGHTRLAYVGGPRGSWAATERRDAVRRTSRASGVQLVEIESASPTVEAASAAVDVVLGQRATAVMAFNDQLALGIIASLTRRGVRVPDDISVVGCDDVPLAEIVSPPLTTIHMPAGEAGAAAVSLLQGSATTVELAGTFVIRGSTGPVTARRASGRATGGRRSLAAGRG